MSGACRETYLVTRNPKALLRWRSWKWNWRLILVDNLAWMVCAVFGHRPYNTSTINDKPEHACHRCHRWLRALDPQHWFPPNYASEAEYLADMRRQSEQLRQAMTRVTR